MAKKLKKRTMIIYNKLKSKKSFGFIKNFKTKLMKFKKIMKLSWAWKVWIQAKIKIPSLNKFNSNEDRLFPHFGMTAQLQNILDLLIS